MFWGGPVDRSSLRSSTLTGTKTGCADWDARIICVAGRFDDGLPVDCRAAGFCGQHPPRNRSLIYSSVEMALFGTIWHCLRGCVFRMPSQETSYDNQKTSRYTSEKCPKCSTKWQLLEAAHLCQSLSARWQGPTTRLAQLVPLVPLVSIVSLPGDRDNSDSKPTARATFAHVVRSWREPEGMLNPIASDT